MYSIAAAICLATRFAWSSPMPLSETFDVKSPIETVMDKGQKTRNLMQIYGLSGKIPVT